MSLTKIDMFNSFVDQIIKKYGKTKISKKLIAEMTDNFERGTFEYSTKTFLSERFGNDKDAARSIYLIVLHGCENPHHLAHLGGEIYARIQDKELSENIFKRALAVKNINSKDLRTLADFIAYDEFYGDVDGGPGYGDKVWGKEVFDLSIEKAASTYDFIHIFEALYKHPIFGDKTRAPEILKRAVNVAKSSSDFLGVASTYLTQYDKFHNNDVAKISRYPEVHDDDLAKQLYQKALNLCENLEDKEEVYLSIKYDMGDDISWLKI